MNSPLSGTCVGSDVVRILALEEDGTLVEVWRCTTFEAEGSRSRVASVEFIDPDGNGNLEILQRGELIDCGDEYLCREGAVLEHFETLFEWNPEKGRFVAVPRSSAFGGKLPPISSSCTPSRATNRSALVLVVPLRSSGGRPLETPRPGRYCLCSLAGRPRLLAPLGRMVTPGFPYDRFTLFSDSELFARYPQHATLIRCLT